MEYSATKEALDDLRTLIKDGFKGVHDRQDITNGRVNKGEIDQARTDEALKNLGREVFRRRQMDYRPADAAKVKELHDAESSALTRRDLRIVIATLGIAGAVTLFMVKVLPALVKAIAP